MYLNSIKQILDKYNIFFIDIWGVLHNGNTLFPEAKIALQLLRSHNKKIFLITNSPNRVALIKQKLILKNITEDLYDNIISSGEVFFHFITESKEYTKYFWLAGKNDKDFLQESNLLSVENARDADFIVIQGYDNIDDAKKILLDNSKKPIFCINPDIYVNIENEIFYCAGYLAQYFELSGGNIHYFGKPYPEIYQFYLDNYAPEKSKNSIIAIGDNINTDIKGAINFGIDSVLVNSGVSNIHQKNKSYNPTYIIDQLK
jgi:HAD superfamily hydrolase (TIGR01459 family)